MGSIRRWQEAHSGLASWFNIRARRVSGLSALASGSLVSTFGGGGGTFWHSNCSRMKMPRAVGEVSVGPALAARNDASPRIPARWESAGNFTISNSPAGGGTLYSVARSVDRYA